VATYQRGVQIGAQIGEEQAQQRYREMALAQQAQQDANRQRLAEISAAREQQQMEQQMAYREAQIGLDAAETGRRVQAQMKFRDLVNAGTDPMQAMMQTPELWGNSLAGVAQMIKADKEKAALAAFQPRTVNIGGHDLLELRPNYYIAAPKTAQEGPVQMRPVLGADNQPIPNMVADPNGAIHSLGRQSDSQKVIQERILRDQLKDINKLISEEAPGKDKLLVRKRKILKTLEDLTGAQAGMFDDEETEPNVQTAAPGAKLIGVRSIKRIQ
jgi:hypothetical protein